MRRSTAKLLSVICSIAVILICCLFIPSGNEAAITIIFILYIPILILLNYYQRCPHCGRWPRKGDFWHEYCPRCGQPLDDE